MIGEYLAIMIIVVSGSSGWVDGGYSVAVEQVEFIDMETCEAALPSVSRLSGEGRRYTDGPSVVATCVTR